jgi:hypothetical protein
MSEPLAWLLAFFSASAGRINVVTQVAVYGVVYLQVCMLQVHNGLLIIESSAVGIRALRNSFVAAMYRESCTHALVC